MARMALGADKKSLTRLGAVLTVLAAVVYYQFFSGTAPAGSGRSAAVPTPAASAAQPAPAQAKAEKTFRRGERFRPRMGRSKTEAPPDPRTADPTLRTDLLAGVRGVAFEAIERDIFNFGVRKPTPPPPSEEKTRAAQQRLQEQLARQREESRAEPPKPGKPAMPRLTWKYYGLAGKPGVNVRRGFLLDGEEIVIGGEGEVLRDRYKIKSIGFDAIVIEDLQFEQEQTLALAEPR